MTDDITVLLDIRGLLLHSYYRGVDADAITRPDGIWLYIVDKI